MASVPNKILISSQQDDVRLDNFLSKEFLLPKNLIYKEIRKGNIKVNKKKKKYSYRLKSNDEISIYGNYAEWKEDDLKDDALFKEYPFLLKKKIKSNSKAFVTKKFPDLFIHPKSAQLKIEWAQKELGYKNLDELIKNTVPENILLKDHSQKNNMSSFLTTLFIYVWLFFINFDCFYRLCICIRISIIN